MRVTSLIEGCESPDHPELQAEFGLSLHVEHQSTRILFDTGAFTQNAKDLGRRGNTSCIRDQGMGAMSTDLRSRTLMDESGSGIYDASA